MFDMLIRGARLVDPVNRLDGLFDIAVEDGRIARVAPGIEGSAKTEIDARGKIAVPGIIDMHTHMRTVMGHPHAQRMVALAGVTTALDMAGPLDNILDSIPTSGAGINVAVLEAAPEPLASASARRAMIEEVLDKGGIGIKLMGGHFPMDLDVSAGFVDDANALRAWVAWHVGNKTHGSDLLGFLDAVKAAEGKYLHIAHINSYCRSQITDEVDEALRAIEALKANPNIFSESYLSPLNGTRLTVVDDKPVSRVTRTCLLKKGCTPDRAGLEKALREGLVGLLKDTGEIGELVYGEEALRIWLAKETVATGSFAVNPAASRFLLAGAKRDDGTFVVDSFSTDGGTYPRNVIVENGLALVRFGALTLKEFVIKSSVNGARALGLAGKGHLGVGADADITILDPERLKAYATVAGGRVIMMDGRLTGSGTTIICDERGEKTLRDRGIPARVKAPIASPDVFSHRPL